jgi:thioredoxin reductase (NADPH)
VSYRQIHNPELDRFHGAGVFYGAVISQASVITGQDVVVVGGGNSAGQAASFLAAHARKVTLLVRRGSLATSMSDYLIRTLHHTPNIDIRYHTEIIGASGERRLQRLTIRDTSTAAPDHLATAAVFVMIGAEPPTGWLPGAIRRDPWGYLMTGDDARPGAGSSRFETSIPGVYAVGDVRHGATKRVASSVGEGSVVIGSVHRYLTHVSEK